MTNYTYGWVLRDRGYIDIDQSAWTTAQMEMKIYIDMLSVVVAVAQCGWDGVVYKVMQDRYGSIESFMVLTVDGTGERWIPITGNSKGANLQVLGENLW